MQNPTPPTAAPSNSAGPLQKLEARLAWAMLAPTLVSASLVVILPLLAVFWISVKPITLSDLRVPAPRVYERIKGSIDAPGDTAVLEYRLTNSSKKEPVLGVTLRDTLPEGMTILQLDTRCALDGRALFCTLGDWAPGYREKLRMPFSGDQAYIDAATGPRDSPAEMRGTSTSVLFNNTFTLDNFIRVFDGRAFWAVIGATLFYAVFGTLGALVVGLFAALLLNKNFKGQGLLRGLFLFPYVAPVIAVAFTWVTLFDPFSGSANALLTQMGVIAAPINFFGARPQALVMVTVFEIWRYFPMAFLFILARMQSIDTDMYEAADMDGASPFQKFWYLSLPQLVGILSVLFLLRFIWTFNKFDDIFLLTGGSAGTRTLTVDVYEQAFAISNIGAGAAVAVVIFLMLIVFSVVFFKYGSREEGL